jgi:hypothetical protein
MKIRPVEAELWHRTDGRTDERTVIHNEANSQYPEFCECALISLQRT